MSLSLAGLGGSAQRASVKVVPIYLGFPSSAERFFGGASTSGIAVKTCYVDDTKTFFTNFSAESFHTRVTDPYPTLHP